MVLGQKEKIKLIFLKNGRIFKKFGLKLTNLCARERPEPHLIFRYRPFAAKILCDPFVHGDFARARDERSGAIPKTEGFPFGKRKMIFGPEGLGAKRTCAPVRRTPPEGWCSQAAERSGECGAKRKISRTCTRRVQVHAHDPHTYTVRIARTRSEK